MNWKQLTVYAFLGFAAAVLCCNALAGENTDNNAEKKAYEDAYKLISEQDWSKAVQAMQSFIEKYPKSTYRDDAGYWYCYALENSGDDSENSYDCYDRFNDEFKDSVWVKTAKSRMIVLSKKLEKLGKVEFTENLEALKENGNTEIVIEAIYAIGERGSDQSVDKLVNIYKKKENKKIRDAVVFALANNSSSKAADALYDILKNEKNPVYQKDLIFWIGQKNDERAVKTLKEIIFGDYSFEAQKDAMFSLASGGGSMNESRVDILLEVIKSHSNPKLKNEAIFWLGEKKSPKVMKFYEEYAFANNPIETTKALLFSIQNYGTSESLDLMVKIAKNHPDVKIRKEAIFWLGQSKNEKAIKALEEIIEGL